MTRRLGDLPAERGVMPKLTPREVPDLYAPLTHHPCVVPVAALSGGHARDEACRRRAANSQVISSFSPALTDGLRRPMDAAEFAAAIAEIVRASTVKNYLSGALIMINIGAVSQSY